MSGIQSNSFEFRLCVWKENFSIFPPFLLQRCCFLVRSRPSSLCCAMRLSSGSVNSRNSAVIHERGKNDTSRMKRTKWKTEELVEHWTLDVEDRTLLDNKTGATRLGFAVLLKFFRREGRFPSIKMRCLVLSSLTSRRKWGLMLPPTCSMPGRGAPSNIIARKSARRLASVSQASPTANRCNSGL